MKSAILYSTLTPRSDASRYTPVFFGPHTIWLRIEVVDGTPLDTLCKARPWRGETVLNSIPLDDAEPTATGEDMARAVTNMMVRGEVVGMAV